MNIIAESKMQTPIEIALGIDENGMTTARKLYEFLELNIGNYSRWCKRNIVDNEFAEENIDYWAVLPKEENSSSMKSLTGRGNTEDYRLTARFAKKLSMMAKSEKGEQAREYFTKVEDVAAKAVERLQEMSSNPMKLLELHYEAIKQVDQKVDTLEDRFNKLEADMPVFNIDAKNIQSAVKKRGIEILGGKNSNAYNDRSTRTSVYVDIQCMLRRNFGIRRYEEIKHRQANVAVHLVEDYIPPLILKEKVKMMNSQLTLNL